MNIIKKYLLFCVFLNNNKADAFILLMQTLLDKYIQNIA